MGTCMGEGERWQLGDGLLAAFARVAYAWGRTVRNALRCEKSSSLNVAHPEKRTVEEAAHQR